jgi:CRP-like cAMP-binding protein
MMEINLTLTANIWQLAPQLERSDPWGGIMLVKNVAERTYLSITPAEWHVLTRFNEPRTVPQALEKIIDERLSPALGEFYELMLKAVRAHILVAPGRTAETVPAANWVLAISPSRLHGPLWILLLAGFGFTVSLHPALPSSFLGVLAGGAVLALALAAGAALAASLLRGGGGEVYIERGWLIRATDACMLQPAEQTSVALAPLAVMASATGLLTWTRPEWSFLPLVGLLVMLRPVLGGAINRLIRARAAKRLSDSRHTYLFPRNRTARARWRLLRAGLNNKATWAEIGYGVIWTMALGYFVGVLTEVPPWTLAFWKEQGPRLGMAIAGSLLLLGIVYVGSEFYLFARERALARRETLRIWWGRWFSRKVYPAEEADRMRAVRRSTLLRLLPPPVQQTLAESFKPHRVGAWKTMHDFGAPIDRVSLILSGRVGVYRKLPTGRRTLVQVLDEGDLVGLHAVGDPAFPQFLYRTLTPVVLLQIEWAQAAELIVARTARSVLANQVQKLPFLTRLNLRQNWHLQAIQRFAELSTIANYKAGEIILEEGYFSENFFIMFEGTARIFKDSRQRDIVRVGSFFGEIGLLQNSNATARVMANEGARSLCIRRKEFLRFVAHNYSVALELERVSTLRLGRPIFPLTPGNFRST